MNIITLIIVLVFLVLLSAFFSATETAFTSCNRIRIRNMADNGSGSAKRVQKLLDSYDRLLTTILIGNNIVNITYASLATILFARLIADGSVALTISTVVSTIVVLIFGEVTPKSISKEHSESVAMLFSAPVKLLTVIFFPISFLFLLWKKLINKVFKSNDEVAVTDEELITYVEEAESEGEIDEKESKLIRSAIEFDDLTAEDIFIPRVQIVAIDVNTSMDDIGEIFRESNFSRLPVYSGTIDSIVGLLHEKDYYHALFEKKKDINDYIQKTVCVSRTMKISDIMQLLQREKTHMSIVVDEFGGTAGIVTLEDILEELVGEIYDEHDEIVETVKKTDEYNYSVNCSMNLDDMFEFFNKDRDEDEESTALSVGGWVTEKLGKIPTVGESFSFENWIVTVKKADEKRVIEVNIFIGASDDEGDQQAR